MSDAKLEQLLQDASSGGFTALQELLRFLRKEKIRRPDICLEYGPRLLQFQRSLGDETWTIHEQIATAAMDTGDLAMADEELKILKAKFADSQRVRWVEGMLAESRGDFATARSIYKAMVEENPANQLARKRQVAVLIAQGDTTGAVKALNEYLGDFAADAEAWLQMAKLHVGVSNYEAAAFCYEEMVLISPSDHLMHCRLAEVYYTMGGIDNLKRARKHFSQSLDLLKTGNARALHGLCQTCASLAANKASSKFLGYGREKEVNEALHLFAATELRRAYTGTGNNEVASLVDQVLVAQSAAISSDS